MPKYVLNISDGQPRLDENHYDAEAQQAHHGREQQGTRSCKNQSRVAGLQPRIQSQGLGARGQAAQLTEGDPAILKGPQRGVVGPVPEVR